MMKNKFIFLTLLFFNLYLTQQNQTNQKKEDSKIATSETTAVSPQLTDQKELVAGLPLYNLFYLSKYLAASNLNGPQKSAINGQFFNLLGQSKINILNEAKSPNFNNLKTYLISILTNSPANLEFIDLLQNSRWEEFDKRYTIIKNKELYKSIKKDKGEIEKLIEKKNNQITELDKKNSAAKNLLQKSDSVSIESTETKNYELEIKQLELEISETDQNINTKQELVEQNIKTLSEENLSDKLKSISQNTVNAVSKYYVDSQLNKPLQLTNNYVQSIQSQGTSSLKVPSQAQLIDAMAIFLANRAKQETALWFMDQLRLRLKNPLVKDAFPQTFDLLKKLEDYKVPNFGLEWRYAISSDFVNMPQNIIDKSSWIKETVDEQQLKNAKTLITFGSNMNRLMAENYNYKDLIQSLYLTELENKKSSELTDLEKYLSKNIALLYVITNELYSIDNINNIPTFRLLTFEELNSLNDSQWNFLIELVHLKYFSDEDNKRFENISEILKKLKKEETSIFAGKIMLNLSQFDKIRNEMQNSKESLGDNISKQNFYSTWKIIDQILENLSNSPTSLSNTNDIQQVSIQKIRTSLSIYENIQNRNFGSAIQKTLLLLEVAKPANISDSKEKIGNKLITLKTEGNALIFKLFSNPDDFKSDRDIIKPYVKIESYNEFQNLWKVSKNYFSNLDFLKDNFTIDTKEFKNILKESQLSAQVLLQKIDEMQSCGEKKSVIPLYKTEKKASEKIQYFKIFNDKYSSQLLKLTSFFGDVLSTTNSTQLSDVISSHALPPTSYKLKRKVKYSIDLNGYVGLYGGYRFPTSNSVFTKSLTGGITAPIGITYTFRPYKDRSLRLGISLNIVDLGNIVNHYLTNTEKYYKDVHFSEVFSPNLNLLIAIPKTPFVGFIGTSLLPLKNILVDDTVKNNRAFDLTTIQAGIKIDIPLLNIKTGTEN